jgi:Taurine catabolism dioxygenase TauD, TfdA family
MSAMRFPEVPRLTADEVSCFMYFDSFPKRPGVGLGMQLQTGDVQFLSNFVTVHNRTAFADDPEDPAHQRHLLRPWISRPEAGRSAPSTRPGAAATRRNQRQPAPGAGDCPD